MEASKRRYGLARMLALAAGVAALDCGSASAQPNEPTTVLPDIYVTNTRLVGGARGARRGVAPGTGADVEAEAPADTAGPSGIVTGTIITGASSTVITAQEIERSPGQTLQDVLAREPGIQMRNLFGMVNGASDHRRHARLRRRRHVEHAGSDQRPPAQRHRHGRRRFQRDPEEQHRADRDHPRQFRRRALRRRRGRRRHQHRHQERRRPAAIGARAGGLRLVQLPGRQSVREHVRENIGGAVRGGGARQRDPLRRLSREQQTAPEERGRRFPLDQRARHQRLSQRLGRRPASRIAGRPAA